MSSRNGIRSAASLPRLITGGKSAAKLDCQDWCFCLILDFCYDHIGSFSQNSSRIPYRGDNVIFPPSKSWKELKSKNVFSAGQMNRWCWRISHYSLLMRIECFLEQNQHALTFNDIISINGERVHLYLRVKNEDDYSVICVMFCLRRFLRVGCR